MGYLHLRGRSLTVAMTAACGTAFMLFGYDQGVFGGILNHPVFQQDFDDPSAVIEGQIVSTYDLGCILGALGAIFIGDRLGRRRTIAVGCLWVVLGGVLQASSYSLGQMIAGRIVAGLGVGSNSVAVPMWQSEMCKPQHRGRLVAVQLAVTIGGIALSNWINLAFSYVTDSDVAWRFPLAFQSVIALAALALLAPMPESPRWLCSVDRRDEAGAILARVLDKERDDDPAVLDVLNSMVAAIAHEREAASVGWRDVVFSARKGGDQKQTLRRLLLGAGLPLMQQMGGINVVVYYLPVILTGSFGFDAREALILSACDFMSLVFWGLVAVLVVDRWGRRRLLLWGAFAQGICFAVATAGVAVDTKPSQAVAVSAIFMYHVFFGVCWLSIPFGYPSEINSQRMRNLGGSVAMMTHWLFVYIIVLVTPIGIENIGWKFYAIFAATNWAWVPIVWYFYVETANLSLEEIDRLFIIHYQGKGSLSFEAATRLAKEQTSIVQVSSGSGEKSSIDANVNQVAEVSYSADHV